MDSISGTITRNYDNLDRLTSEITPQGSVTYGYDAASRRTSMTVAGQPSVVYSYDNANRLTQITQGTSTVIIGYDAASRRTSLTLPNNIVVQYDYDNANRVTGITYKLGVTVLGNLTYTYDAAGNRTQIGGTFARTGLPAAVASAVYNAANQLTQWGATTLTYDNNGNLLSDGTNTYTWNARNQLATIAGGAAATFVYDGLGRRQRKIIGAARTEFLYDRFNPVQETDGPTILANILGGLGIDEVFVRTGSAGARNFLTDALHSTVALADGAGTVQTEYTYEPFGNTTVTGAVSTNSFQYTGRENDGTGLYYYRARYYHPAFQRFISEDPIMYLPRPNLYEYAFNSPLKYIDPYGRMSTPTAACLSCLGGAAIVIPGAAAAGCAAGCARSCNFRPCFNDCFRNPYSNIDPMARFSALVGCGGLCGFAIPPFDPRGPTTPDEPPPSPRQQAEPFELPEAA